MERNGRRGEWGWVRAGACLLASLGFLAAGCNRAAMEQKMSNPLKRTEKAVALHIKNLKSPDPEVRKVSAQMLGQINNPDAIGPLIAALKDEDIWVQIYANGSLVRLTGRNFGYKNYDDWNKWWQAEHKEFLKKYEKGFSPTKEERAKLQNTIGLQSLRRGYPRQAQYYFTDAVSQDPRIPDYHNNLGLAYLRQGRHVDAYESFKTAMSLAPELVQPYINIGDVYSNMGKRPEAEHWYRKAVAMDKDEGMWEPLWKLGRHCLQKRDYQQALDSLERCEKRAVKLGVRDPRIHRDMALAYYGAEQIFSAWEELKIIREMGFDLNEDFVNKLKDELKRNGFDPEAPGNAPATPRQPPSRISDTEP